MYLPVEGKNMVYHYCFSFLFFGHFHQPSLPGLAVMRVDRSFNTTWSREWRGSKDGWLLTV